MSDDTGLRYDLIFDAGEDGLGPPVWKILLPAPGGTENLYGVHEFLTPDAAQLGTWLTPVVGSDATAELIAAVEASPPASADWRHPAGG